MDPKRVYASWGPSAETELVSILRSHAYVKGKHVAGVEEELAAFVGVPHAVAVDSGTDALWLVLRAVLAQRPEHAREVILPTFTFVATASAVANAGGTAVFADVDPETMNLTPATVAPHLSARTAAVIPVHLFGNPADVAGIRALTEAAGTADPIFILEDAAQAIDATLGGTAAGALGDAGAFSFYPSKNLGAAGDGGLVTTSDAELAALVRALRDHGQTKKLYDHTWVGTNSRMDEMQAAVLRAKLPHLSAWTNGRRRIAQRYDEAFAGTACVPQRVTAEARSAYHLYTVRLAARDAVREQLTEAGVASGIYYPRPLHRQSCFGGVDVTACPEADLLAESVLSLPCFPGLRDEEQDAVIHAVRGAL